MPALPAAAGVIRTALSGFASTGHPWLTRFYVHYTGTAPTNAQLLTYDAAVASAYTADLQSLVDLDTQLAQIASEDLTSATGAVDTSAVNIVGTRAGTTFLPAGVAMVTSYEIARRYRGGHPRGYWRMGTPSDSSQPGQWNNAFVTAVQTGVTNFFTAVLGAGWTGAGTLTHVNVSYYSGFHVVTDPLTGRARNVPLVRVSPVIDTVTTIVARASFGEQRRRNQFID